MISILAGIQLPIIVLQSHWVVECLQSLLFCYTLKFVKFVPNYRYVKKLQLIRTFVELKMICYSKQKNRFLTDLKAAADPCKTLLDWLAQYYTESCVLTNFFGLAMLLISVSGSAECAGCVYRTTISRIFLTWLCYFRLLA